MPAKMKGCFTYHVVLHSLFGLGLGVLFVSLIPSLGMWWLGLVIMAVATVLDAMRKTSGATPVKSV
jgi:hypothetical protein